MMKLKVLLLAGTVFLPVITLFVFDARYNHLQDELCNEYSSLKFECAPYPERYERQRFISTAFYRHLGAYLGREEGTSNSFIKKIRWVPRIYDEQNREAAFEANEAEERLGKFNQGFFVAVIFSVAVAASALTILLQKLSHHYSNKLHHDKRKG